ncbi:uncharacterized protein MONBRDRAFT_37197 [Monosiga brevicollis MX1]|uniref:Uncharacterized protein n=1 Tax=Monosiga brevicollis TaxID=81824 RepID=A9V070_MONBE|nr:uncharacterized protein MONBRDRAFT_37197 [Monosiga brevicollis MX1]EDQ89106.1 predicted protein [Monosiga brevicollis MX1]|eukprot:XP_001746211.1 hypothetical protein [Monosiga brevicollis MX1]
MMNPWAATKILNSASTSAGSSRKGSEEEENGSDVAASPSASPKRLLHPARMARSHVARTTHHKLSQQSQQSPADLSGMLASPQGPSPLLLAHDQERRAMLDLQDDSCSEPETPDEPLSSSTLQTPFPFPTTMRNGRRSPVKHGLKSDDETEGEDVSNQPDSIVANVRRIRVRVAARRQRLQNRHPTAESSDEDEPEAFDAKSSQSGLPVPRFLCPRATSNPALLSPIARSHSKRAPQACGRTTLKRASVQCLREATSTQLQALISHDEADEDTDLEPTQTDSTDQNIQFHRLDQTHTATVAMSNPDELDPSLNNNRLMSMDLSSASSQSPAPAESLGSWPESSTLAQLMSVSAGTVAEDKPYGSSAVAVLRPCLKRASQDTPTSSASPSRPASPPETSKTSNAHSLREWMTLAQMASLSTSMRSTLQAGSTSTPVPSDNQPADPVANRRATMGVRVARLTGGIRSSLL